MNFYQPNVDNMQEYLKKQQENKGDGPNWWSIPAGMSSIRILPPWDPTGRVALPVFMHPIEFKGEGMSYTKYNWTCVNKTFNKPCPICEGLANMAASGVDISKWEANRRQFYLNAIIMHDPTFDQKGKGVAPGTHVLLRAPKTLYDWVIAQITNPMIGDITSVTNGIDIYVTKEGTGLGTTYNMTLSPNGRTAVPEEYLSKITDLYNLDDIFSAGFDQKQIDELVNSLKKSAGVLSNAVPNMASQMAGYTQTPVYQQPTVQQYAPQPAAQNFNPMQTVNNPPMFNPMVSAPTSQVAAPASNPFAAQTPQPMAAPVDNPPWAAPVQAASAEAPSNLPKCFGNYDSGSVTCVVCPHEINCSKSKQ